MEKQFLIEGYRAVNQAGESGALKLSAIIIESGAGYSPSDFEFEASRPDIFEAGSGDFQKLADTQSSQVVIAVAQIPDELQDYPNADGTGTILALDDISDPGNMGSIYRTAAWYGVQLILLGENCVDLYNPKVVRSTAGATGSIPVKSGSMDEVLTELNSEGWHPVLMDLNPGAGPVSELSGRQNVILVIGNEAHGISEALKNKFESVYIPGRPAEVESLNAAVSAGIAMHVLQSEKITAGKL